MRDFIALGGWQVRWQVDVLKAAQKAISGAHEGSGSEGIHGCEEGRKGMKVAARIRKGFGGRGGCMTRWRCR